MNKTFNMTIARMAVLAVILCIVILFPPTVYANAGLALRPIIEVRQDALCAAPEEGEPQSIDTANAQLIPGIPNTHLFMFAGGSLACTLGLVVMRAKKHRKYKNNDED